MKTNLITLLLGVVFLASCASDDNTITPPNETDLTFVNAFSNLNFTRPIDIQNADDGTNRLFVVEKGGIIKVIDNSTTPQSFDFLDISSLVSSGGEQGLLGLAFHPNYSTNGYFYINYTPTPNTTRVSRFKVSDTNPFAADPNSELVLFSFFQVATNHNGGQVAFGNDGYLYISSGDGGNSNNGQDLTTLTGTILRIDVDNMDPGLNYSIPASNPFINDANARDEIFAYGLRNPWRMSFDRNTGQLWAGDVGSVNYEEVNIIASGNNYGWNRYEGTECQLQPCDTSGLTMPFYFYEREASGSAITGGHVYRGNLNPEIAGMYVYGDSVTGKIWALDTNSADNELLFDTDINITGFGVDESNELYFCDFFGGMIYKFVTED